MVWSSSSSSTTWYGGRCFGGPLRGVGCGLTFGSATATPGESCGGLSLFSSAIGRSSRRARPRFILAASQRPPAPEMAAPTAQNDTARPFRYHPAHVELAAALVWASRNGFDSSGGQDGARRHAG